jgi:diguanylate cyclase (GGDEF)-like protein/PAS domain S-box-containing protein
MTADLPILDEAFWRQLVENDPDIILCIDAGGRILYVNHVIPGFSREGVLGASAFEFVPPQSIELLRAAVTRVFALERPETFEIAGAGPNGSLAWYLARVGPMLRDGKVAAVAVAATDISERRKTEIALQQARDALEHQVALRTVELTAATAGLAAEINRHRETGAALDASERKYRTLFEANPETMWVYDIETLRFLAVNQAAVSRYGWSEAKFLTMTLKDIRPMKEIPKLIRSLTAELPGPDYSENWRHVKADGSMIWVSVASHPIMWGGRQARLVLSRDITRQLLDEEEIGRSRKQYAEAQQLAHLGSWDWDIPAGALSWSDELFRIYGFNPGEFTVTYEAFLDRVHEGDRPHVREAVEKAFQDHQPFNYHERIVRPDGTQRTLFSQGHVVVDGDGNPVRMYGTCLDVTEQRRAEEALREGEKKYRLLFEDNPEAMWVYDRETLKFLAVNRRTVERYGWSREEFLAMDIEAVRPPGELERLRHSLKEQPDLEQSKNWLHWRKDGSRMWVNAASRSITFAGRPARLVHLQDVTEQKRAEEALQESERLHKAVFESAADAFAILNSAGEVMSVNDTFTRLFGFSAEELKGRSLHPAIVPDEELEPAMRNREVAMGGEIAKSAGRRRRRDGTVLDVEIACSRVILGGEPCLLTRYTDITERRVSEEKIQRLAYHDSLTGLPNRAQLAGLMRQALHQAQRHQRQLGVLFIDLDRFKAINDSLGHNAGDELLQQAAGRLAELVRKSDVLARLGGDEFIILLTDIADNAAAALVSQKILERFQEPFVIGGAELFVTASIGVSCYPESGGDPEQLINHADAAMYRAKELGRNNVQLHVPAKPPHDMEMQSL